ncbi:RagB/SusD family nutrient uptake outer membrane protein [Chitinophaga barathri]|uniref:RagB/SusD family nutrient uptake outer membrane protein n=1 Tax=Chitinophaga barathri TaxID=1647451 RepID=A0A3N4MG49_9BACT|nr:RagB/SusD family nutrient uptake outer membrane protein [Chitinophaga barathri]RPD42568.1 RagB/SusD family nutrient uptake outer membrane protein [Chitinophaga barathri]
MKRLLIYTSVFLAFTAAGCKKYLEQPPDMRAELNTPEQVSRLLGTAYPQANYMAFTEGSSDNVADKRSGTIENTNTDPFQFRDVRDDQEDSPEYYWNACYAAIAAANLAIQACDKAPDPENYRSQKGEALVARAYAHFMLVTFFSETYDPATAATSPGIPYVTEPENVVIKQYERKTVAYVYEMIENDLLMGMPMLDNNRYSVPAYHFTTTAAYAFASRFYLFKQDWTKAVTYATLVFPDNNITPMLRPWNTRYMTITYLELFSIYAKATEPANLLLVETPSVYGRYYFNFRYAMNPAKRNEILSDNVTGGEWAFWNQSYSSGSTENQLIPKVNEYFVRSTVNAGIGTAYVMVPLFTAEEVLFNRAEAYTYLNNTGAAIEDLNTYAATRISSYNAGAHGITPSRVRNFYGTNNLQTALIRTILDFKRAEYVQEGMRWFDILRYRIPVSHTVVGGGTFNLTGNDPRRLFQIPSSAAISGVQGNPR